MKEAPPSHLLSLVGAFMTSFGFNSSCRIFTEEWKAKAEMLDDWVFEDVGKKLPIGMPSLLKIYKDWDREWDAKDDS